MDPLNLDELEALRKEAAKDSEPKEFTFRGETYTLPDELPWRATLQLADPTKQEDAFRLLLGDDQFDRFIAGEPSVDNIADLASRMETLYIGGSGNGRSASGRSSRNTHAKPRPTSNASTG